MDLQVIQSKIYEIRSQRVMLDRDLAEMYDVETRALNQAVKRNIERFPDDFLSQLDDEEFQNWKSQIVITLAAPRLSDSGNEGLLVWRLRRSVVAPLVPNVDEQVEL